MLDRIKMIIGKYTDVDAEDITPESALMADLHLSSFDLVSIVTEFEEEFDLEVADREIMKFVTIGDIMKYLEEHA